MFKQPCTTTNDNPKHTNFLFFFFFYPVRGHFFLSVDLAGALPRHHALQRSLRNARQAVTLASARRSLAGVIR